MITDACLFVVLSLFFLRVDCVKLMFLEDQKKAQLKVNQKF